MEPLRPSIKYSKEVNEIIKRLDKLNRLEHEVSMLWAIMKDKFNIWTCEKCDLEYFVPFTRNGIVFQGKAYCADCLENPSFGEEFDDETYDKFLDTLGRWFARCQAARSNHWFVEPEVQDRIKKYAV